jgi:hypothetical protein
VLVGGVYIAEAPLIGDVQDAAQIGFGPGGRTFVFAMATNSSIARRAPESTTLRPEVWAQMRQEMLTAMTYFTADLQATGQLRPGESTDEVRDVLWAYHCPEIYELLVLERGWSTQQYGRFVGEAMISAVLDAE